MKKILIGLSALLALARAPAFAADMPVKAPPLPPAPVSSWTGWYAGLNAGGAWQSDPINNSFAETLCAGIVPSACAAVALDGNTFLSNLDPKTSGFIGGGQIGYDYQVNSTVVGIEADFQGANLHGSASATGTVPSGVPGITFVETGTGTEKTDWLGTVRGRFGWTPTPPLLIYATGGVAYGHVQTSASISGSFPQNPAPVFGSTTLSQSDTRAGPAVGAGFEWMFAPRWSAKAEYLYYDLGKVTLDQSFIVAVPSMPGELTGTNVQSAAHYSGSIARVGINYHF